MKHFPVQTFLADNYLCLQFQWQKQLTAELLAVYYDAIKIWKKHQGRGRISTIVNPCPVDHAATFASKAIQETFCSRFGKLFMICHSKPKLEWYELTFLAKRTAIQTHKQFFFFQQKHRTVVNGFVFITVDSKQSFVNTASHQGQNDSVIYFWRIDMNGTRQ